MNQLLGCCFVSSSTRFWHLSLSWLGLSEPLRIQLRAISNLKMNQHQRGRFQPLNRCFYPHFFLLCFLVQDAHLIPKQYRRWVTKAFLYYITIAKNTVKVLKWVFCCLSWSPRCVWQAHEAWRCTWAARWSATSTFLSYNQDIYSRKLHDVEMHI